MGLGLSTVKMPYSTSNRNVTGPTLTKASCMMTPAQTISTGAPCISILLFSKRCVE